MDVVVEENVKERFRKSYEDQARLIKDPIVQEWIIKTCQKIAINFSIHEVRTESFLNSLLERIQDFVVEVNQIGSDRTQVQNGFLNQVHELIHT
jgi:hypothetical protein